MTYGQQRLLRLVEGMHICSCLFVAFLFSIATLLLKSDVCHVKEKQILTDDVQMQAFSDVLTIRQLYIRLRLLHEPSRPSTKTDIPRFLDSSLSTEKQIFMSMHACRHLCMCEYVCLCLCKCIRIYFS